MKNRKYFGIFGVFVKQIAIFNIGLGFCKTMALRITTTIFIINATSVWLVLSMPAFPQLLGLFHGILAVIMLMRIAMVASGQNPPTNK